VKPVCWQLSQSLTAKSRMPSATTLSHCSRSLSPYLLRCRGRRGCTPLELLTSIAG
jgi:hypothetical protein